MYPYYRGYKSNFQLDQDDIDGIRILYGQLICSTLTSPSLWPPCVAYADIIFLPGGFFFFFFFFPFLANLSRRRLDVLPTSTHGVALV